MKGVLCAAAVRGRIDQRLYDLKEFDDRTGPAMRDDDQQCVDMLRADVDEMKSKAIDRGLELEKVVERRLAAPSVIVGSPILDEHAQLPERRTLRPVVHGFAFRPAGLCQAMAQVVQRILRGMVGERRDLRSVRSISWARPEHPGTDCGRRNSGAQKVAAGSKSNLANRPVHGFSTLFAGRNLPAGAAWGIDQPKYTSTSVILPFRTVNNSVILNRLPLLVRPS